MKPEISILGVSADAVRSNSCKKKDGIIFATYCMSDPAILSMRFLNVKIQEIAKAGMMILETFGFPQQSHITQVMLNITV